MRSENANSQWYRSWWMLKERKHLVAPRAIATLVELTMRLFQATLSLAVMLFILFALRGFEIWFVQCFRFLFITELCSFNTFCRYSKAISVTIWASNMCALTICKHQSFWSYLQFPKYFGSSLAKYFHKVETPCCINLFNVNYLHVRLKENLHLQIPILAFKNRRCSHSGNRFHWYIRRTASFWKS